MPNERKVVKVLSSFAYTPEGARDALWITPETPAELLNSIPQEVLEEHAVTGFVQFANTDEQES